MNEVMDFWQYVAVQWPSRGIRIIYKVVIGKVSQVLLFFNFANFCHFDPTRKRMEKAEQSHLLKSTCFTG